MWHITCDMWHVTCDLWHVTHNFLVFTKNARKFTKNAKKCLKLEKSVNKVGFHSIGAKFLTRRESRCLPYAVFFSLSWWTILLCRVVEIAWEEFVDLPFGDRWQVTHFVWLIFFRFFYRSYYPHRSKDSVSPVCIRMLTLKPVPLLALLGGHPCFIQILWLW